MKDFGNHCRLRGGNKRVCKWILAPGGFNSTDLGLKMLNWMNEKNEMREKHKLLIKTGNSPDFERLETIYFASPPIEMDFIKKIGKIIESEGKYRVFYQEHLREFIKEKFKDCDEKRFELQLHDFVSQVEQQICTDAGIFLGSESSTWSGAIGKDRIARNLTKFDGSNIQFL